jgi:DNA-binding NtrC family response regulator
MTPARILIVEDEPYARIGLASTLIALGHAEPATCADLAGARQAIAQGGIDLVLLDLHLPDGNGVTLLEEISAGSPGLPVIVITAAQEVATAVRCMHLHAADYLVKPVEPAALGATVARTLAAAASDREHRSLAAWSREAGLGNPEAFAEFISFDPGMIRVMRHAEILASTGCPVLISGEAGSGRKSLSAAIHRLSGTAGPLRIVRGDVIQTTTDLGGAGTLVIDGLEDLPRGGQCALLTRLRERVPEPRLVITSSAEAKQAVEAGRLRADLLHLLEGHRLHLPPLRDRPGDVAVLIHHLAPRLAHRRGLPPPSISDAFVRRCQAKDWPGNVSQLEAVINTALAHSGGLDAVTIDQPPPPSIGLPLPDPLPTLDQMRDLLVSEALRRSGGNLNDASRMLGISRWGLSKRLKQG